MLSFEPGPFLLNTHVEIITDSIIYSELQVTDNKLARSVKLNRSSFLFNNGVLPCFYFIILFFFFHLLLLVGG